MQALGATGPATELAAGTASRPWCFRCVWPASGCTAMWSTAPRAIASLDPTDNPDRLVGRVLLTDADGRPLLEIDEVEMAVLRSPGGARELSNRLFSLEWEPAARDEQAGAPAALLLVGAPMTIR